MRPLQAVKNLRGLPLRPRYYLYILYVRYFPRLLSPLMSDVNDKIKMVLVLLSYLYLLEKRSDALVHCVFWLYSRLH